MTFGDEDNLVMLKTEFESIEENSVNRKRDMGHHRILLWYLMVMSS